MFCPQRYNNFNSPIAGYNQRSDHTLTDIRGLSDQLQSRSAGVTQLLYDLSWICTFSPNRGIFCASGRPSIGKLLRRNTASLSIHLLILARDVLCGNRPISSIKVLKVSIARSADYRSTRSSQQVKQVRPVRSRNGR